VVRYCLEVAAVPEIECVLAAKETNGLTGCERKRRSVDEKLATATELTEARLQSASSTGCGMFKVRRGGQARGRRPRP
jgi:hypothetical protein